MMRENQVRVQIEHDSVETVSGPANAGVLMLCDHASNAIPEDFGALGMPPAELERHIAYDIGARWVTLAMAERLNCPAILTCFSRLLIDPNRGNDDPTQVMRLSDGAIVPGNRHIDSAGIALRQSRFSEPYHRAISRMIDQMSEKGPLPVLVSIHSFTPRMKGIDRPWHIGILWDSDPRLPLPFMDSLRRESDLVVGDNEPYDGALEGDTLSRHATARGLAHLLIEVRQDLIATETSGRAWGERLARHLAPLLSQPDVRVTKHFPSRTLQRNISFEGADVDERS